MSDKGRDHLNSQMNPPNRASPLAEPVIGALRVNDGVCSEDAAPQAMVLTPPLGATRHREGVRLFILLDLVSHASPHVYRELSSLVAQTYWSTSGSITASLRRAGAAANRHLFQANLRAEPSDRCYAGVTCIALSGDDLFILQAGPARAHVLHGGTTESFPRGEILPPLGIGPVADVRLSHAAAAAGDTLALVSPTLAREGSDEAVARVLRRAKVEDVMAGLREVAPATDFAALVVRWVGSAEAPAVPDALQLPGVPAPEAPVSVHKPPPRPRPARKPGPSLGERMQGTMRVIGRGVAAAGVWGAGTAKTLVRRMLPGPEREARRRARIARPVPKENHAVMMAIAIGIPVALATLVGLVYGEFGSRARFDTLMQQAKAEVAMAQAAGYTSEAARGHWEAMLTPVAAAADLRPDDPSITDLESQAQTALDQLDGVARLNPTLLENLGAGTMPRQLIVHGQRIFVLDPAGGWVARLTLSPAGDLLADDETASVLVRTGQRIEGAEVGNLTDLIWVGREGGRQTDGVVILEEGGALVSHDPAWGGEEGAPQLIRSLLGTPPTGSSRSVSSFEGRLYILDPQANQIWRYEPQGDLYPNRPGHYFVTSPLVSLASVLDMAIDGYVYVLYPEGEILKFLRGEPQGFDVSGVPGDMSQAVALAVDPIGSSGSVYVADRGNGRVVVVGPDGAFQAQFYAEGLFDGLEAIAVDEAAGRLYVMSEGKLYMAAMP